MLSCFFKYEIGLISKEIKPEGQGALCLPPRAFHFDITATPPTAKPPLKKQVSVQRPSGKWPHFQLKTLILKHSSNFFCAFTHSSLGPDLDPAIHRIGNIGPCIGLFFRVPRSRTAKPDDYISQKVNEVSLIEQFKNSGVFQNEQTGSGETHRAVCSPPESLPLSIPGKAHG